MCLLKIISNLDLITIPAIFINVKSKLIMNINKAYEGLIGINNKKIVGFPCHYGNFRFEEKNAALSLILEMVQKILIPI